MFHEIGHDLGFATFEDLVVGLEHIIQKNSFEPETAGLLCIEQRKPKKETINPSYQNFL